MGMDTWTHRVWSLLSPEAAFAHLPAEYLRHQAVALQVPVVILGFSPVAVPVDKKGPNKSWVHAFIEQPWLQ